MSDKYRATYKCRMCGEIFASHDEINGDTCCPEIRVFHMIHDIDKKLFEKIDHHRCKDMSIGIGDFQGLKKESISDEIYKDLCNL